MKKRLLSFLSSILLAVLAFSVIGGAVYGYLYRAPVAITENASTSYSMIPVLWTQNNDWLADNGYMKSTANDTRVATLAGLEKPWLVADNKTLTAIPVPADSQTNLYFVTGESEASAMDIIVGYGGYFTILDNASIEPSDNGSISLTGVYIDTSAASVGENITNKEDAYRAWISSTGNITAAISDNVSPTSTYDATATWSNDDDAIDGNTATIAFVTIGAGAWTEFLQFNHVSMLTDAINTYCSGTDITNIDVDAYYDGAWNNVYSGVFTAGIWETYSLGDTYSVNGTRVRLYNNGGVNRTANIHEVDFDGYYPYVTTSVADGKHDIDVNIQDNTGDGWLAGYDNRIEFTIDADKIDADLTHFPVYLELSAASGINSEDVTTIFDTCSDNYSNIAITQSDGTTQIYIEAVSWSDASNYAELWFSSNTTVLSNTTDTVFYLYYDPDQNNTTYVGLTGSAPAIAVWDSNFVLVDHMSDGADANHTADSTSSSINGTKAGGSPPVETVGACGNYQNATGDGYISYGNPAALRLSSSWTVEALVMQHATDFGFWFGNGYAASGTMSIGSYHLYPNKFWGMFYQGGALEVILRNAAAYETWYYQTVAWDSIATQLKVYSEGVLVTQPIITTSPMSASADREALSSGGSGLKWNGAIDELRISNSERSVAWLKATYYTAWDNVVDWVPADEFNLLSYSLELLLSVDSTVEGRVAGAAVPDNANDLVVMSNATPYMGSFSISVDGVEVSRYEPAAMIIGTTLLDEVGANDATITWGANPAGVGATLSSFTSSGQSSIGATSDTSTSDLLPVVGGADWRPEATVSATLQANPMRPIVTAISDNTTLSEYQVWVWLGVIFVVFITVLVGANVRGHHLITGIAASAAIVLMVVWTVFPLLSLVIIVLAIWGGLVSERSPSL